jgi:hypothetical protein
MVASVPVIVFFGVVLAGLLTSIFVFEAFVTQLYTGPGHKYIVSLLPHVLMHKLILALRYSLSAQRSFS